MCVVSVTVKRPALQPCAVRGRFRNPVFIIIIIIQAGPDARLHPRKSGETNKNKDFIFYFFLFLIITLSQGGPNKNEKLPRANSRNEDQPRHPDSLKFLLRSSTLAGKQGKRNNVMDAIGHKTPSQSLWTSGGRAANRNGPWTWLAVGCCEARRVDSSIREPVWLSGKALGW